MMSEILTCCWPGLVLVSWGCIRNSDCWKFSSLSQYHLLNILSSFLPLQTLLLKSQGSLSYSLTSRIVLTLYFGLLSDDTYSKIQLEFSRCDTYCMNMLMSTRKSRGRSLYCSSVPSQWWFVRLCLQSIISNAAWAVVVHYCLLKRRVSRNWPLKVVGGI